MSNIRHLRKATALSHLLPIAYVTASRREGFTLVTVTRPGLRPRRYKLASNTFPRIADFYVRLSENDRYQVAGFRGSRLHAITIRRPA